MRKSIVFTVSALVAVVVATPGFAQSPVDSVRRIDSIWARAYSALDTLAIDRVLAKDIAVTTSSNAVRTRAEEIADNRPAPGLTMDSFRTRNVDINLFGGNAILVGDAQWDFTNNGPRQVIARRYTATYARGGPLGWQMTALHFFPAAASGAPLASVANAGVEGKWEGALGAGGGRLRLVMEIAKAADGLLNATLYSIDQGGVPIPVERTTQAGDSVHIAIPAIAGRYDAVLSADKTQMNGAFNQQGKVTPLSMTRTAAGSVTQAAAPMPAPVSPFGLLVEATIPISPTPFVGNGKRQLIYELHLTNFAGGELLITKLEALDGARALATFDGARLSGIMTQPRLGTPDNRSITAGGTAIVFMQLTLDSGMAMPARLHHRISAGTQVLDAASIDVATVPAIVIGAPFKGTDWLAANGPGNNSGHRHALLPVGGHPVIAQRFAIDWLRVGPAGSTFTGDRLDNKSYIAYGAEIIAVADGIIASTKDSIPENVPGGRAVQIDMVTIAGNNIVQNLGGGHFALYAHLQPGSLRVKAGDRVKKGQVIGLLGNSGNSTEPHLHFHVMNGPLPLGAEGLPYVIDSFELQNPAGAWEIRTRELPMEGQRIRIVR